MTDVTDPIEKAADAIIELINAQPRSPRKEEIMDVLRLHHPHRPEGYLVSEEGLLKGLINSPDAGQYTWVTVTGQGITSNSTSPFLITEDTAYTNTAADSAAACDLSEASLEKLIAELENFKEDQLTLASVARSAVKAISQK